VNRIGGNSTFGKERNDVKSPKQMIFEEALEEACHVFVAQ